jgi:hypothetical protein
MRHISIFIHNFTAVRETPARSLTAVDLEYLFAED